MSKKFKRRRVSGFDIVNHLFFIVLVFISLFPIYLIAANAFSREWDLRNIGFAVYPLHPNIEAFKMIFRAPQQLLSSLWVSVVNSVGSTFLTVLVSALLAYAISRNDFWLKKPAMAILVGTMFFSAGTIPQYIIRTQYYHLVDNWLVYLIPMVNAFSVFVYKAFFAQIPDSLFESATLDGATDFQVFSKIVVPLSMPALVSQFFMGMIGSWQNYTTSMYFISDPKMYNLEYYIQILMNNTQLMSQNLENMGVSSDSIPLMAMRFAVVFLTVIPLVTVFPLMQKYFSKGAMVGSVKG